MKKILGGILVVLSVLLIGNLKAETLEEPGSRDITATIVNIEGPQYLIDLTWEPFEYNYIAFDEGYIWFANETNPIVNIKNNSTVSVALSFTWESSINGLGMSAMHMENGESESPEEVWYDSLTSGTHFYSARYSTAGGFNGDQSENSANGLLNSTSFIVKNNNQLVSSAREVLWVPENEEDGLDFEFSLIDTQNKRDLSTLEEGQTIGTLTITLDEVE